MSNTYKWIIYTLSKGKDTTCHGCGKDSSKIQDGRMAFSRSLSNDLDLCLDCLDAWVENTSEKKNEKNVLLACTQS